MKNFTIRISKESDFERIFEIWLENQGQAIGKQAEPGALTMYKEDLFHLFARTNRSVFYVAESDAGQIIGWQSLLPLFANPLVSRYAAQSSTYVDRKSANEEIGTALVEFALKDAKRLGIDHIYGWVRADNIPMNKVANHFKTHKFHVPHSHSGNLADFNLYILIVE